VIDGKGNRSVSYVWSSLANDETQQKHFQGLIDATINYILPSVMDRTKMQLEHGDYIRIGPCAVSQMDVGFDVKGWVFTQRHKVPWNRIGTSIQNGDLTVFDTAMPKVKVTMSLRDTPNAFVLRALALSKNPQER
jgi:hypothetical protein